ncbi:ankyrin repeat-containing domain protein [Mycena polygramma]|nr:ankyrin repeat-containing domain protein [Mycena polygramma]
MADVVGLVASILQLVDTVAKTRDYIEDFRNAPHDQRQLLEEIQSLDPLIRELDRRIGGGRAGLVKNLESPLKEVKEVLEQLTKKLDLQGVQKFRSRVTWSLWGKDDIHDGLGTIERFKSLLNAWLGVDISFSVQDVSSSVSAVAKEQQIDHSYMIRSIASSSKAQEGYHEHTVSLLTNATEEQQINHHYLSKVVRTVGKTQEYYHDRTISLFENASEEQNKNHKSLLNTITDVGRKQEEYHNSVERDQMIEWYSPLNMFLRQADVFSAWEPGTGVWLLEHDLFREWKSGAGKALWCQGMPGAGKTVLASLITHTLQVETESENIGVGVIYLEHRESDVPPPSRLLAALWRQLVVGKPISQSLDKLYRKHREPRTRPTIEEDAAVLRSIISEYAKVFIVVDGLDEYPDEQRDILLLHLRAFGPAVNLLLTSRPHIIVGHVVSNFETLEIRATEHDIRLYLDSKISKSSRLSKHVSDSPNLHQQLEATVVERSDGMFLLATLHVNSLTKTRTVKDVRNALGNMADNLDLAYRAVVDRINQQDPGDSKLAWQALAWITHAKRPLRFSELREALGVELGATELDPENLPAMDIVLSVCAGLVKVDREDDKIRLIHYTTEIYLQSAHVRASTFPRAQSDITMTCITYVSFGFEGISQKLRQPIFLFTFNPFLDYAVEYCLIHARGPPESEIQPALLSFLSTCSLWRDLWAWKRIGPPLPSDRLSIAAVFNLEETFGRILEEDGLDFNALLNEAASRGATDVVRTLLENGVNVRAHKPPSSPASQHAPRDGYDAILSLLIDDGAQVNHNRRQGTAVSPMTKRGEGILKLIMGSRTGIVADGGSALRAATKNGNSETAKLLIDGGADINSNDGWALRAAAKHRNAEIIKLLIDGGADMDSKDGWALRTASKDGDEEIVNLLVEGGANVNADGGWALMSACKDGHTGIVKRLIDGGANVNSNQGRALRTTSGDGNTTILNLLISGGADVNSNNSCVFRAASESGNLEVVKLLLDAGADIDANNGEALRTASKKWDTQMVKLLIDAGADVNASNGEALRIASKAGNKEIVKLLVKGGADVEASNGEALCVASEEAIARLLVEAGADTNANSGAALRAAARYRSAKSQVFKLLIEASADLAKSVKLLVGAGAHVANGALYAASRNGNAEVVRLLIEGGAPVDIDGYKGFGSALYAASCNGNAEVVRLLIEGGSDIVANGRYALGAATESGNAKLVKLLTEAGAEIEAKSGRVSGETTDEETVVGSSHTSPQLELEPERRVLDS